MENAAMPDVHEALGEDVLEKPAEKLHAVEGGGPGACTPPFTIRASDRAVCEADETLVRDGHPKDSGGEGGEGGVAVVSGLTVDVPGDSPGLRIPLLQQTGVAPLVFAEGAGDGGERCDGDKDVGSGGTPGRAVR